MAAPGQIIEKTTRHQHAVQLYKSDERALIANVSRYLWEGFRQGAGLLIVASPAHTQAFLRELERLAGGLGSALEQRRIVMLDSAQTLAQLMVSGEPDGELFAAVMRGAMREVRPAQARSGLRAYGEMVGLLWQNGEFSAAIRLEEYWNKLLAEGGCDLFCAYPIDVFGEEFHGPHIDAVLGAHTHLVPTGFDGDLEHALTRSIEEVCGEDRESFATRMAGDGWTGHAGLPQAESSILWLRRNAPVLAGEVLTRAQRVYESEKRFRALVEHALDAISLIDASGTIQYASSSTKNVLGCEVGQILGGNFLELIHPDDREMVAQKLAEALDQPGRPVGLETRMRHASGEWRWMEGTFNNLLGEPDIRALVTNFRDVTVRKAADEKLARAYKEMQAFAYAAAHDLKEPLRTVRSFTQLLVQRVKLDESAEQFAGFVVDGVKRMSALLDALLRLSSLDNAEELQPVSLQSAVEQALMNLGEIILQSGAKIQVQPLPIVLGVATHLVQVFQNLIGNAIQYRGEEPPSIDVLAEARGDQWVIQVKDNGIGIAPAYQQQIFGIFKRLHAQDIPGTGIGLAICKKIIEAAGGRIWVESEPGKGATFCFTCREADVLTSGFPVAHALVQ